MTAFLRILILVGFLLGQVLGQGVPVGHAAAGHCGCVVASAEGASPCCELMALAKQHEPCRCAGGCVHGCLCGCAGGPSEMPAVPPIESLRLMALQSSADPLVNDDEATALLLPRRDMLLRSLLGRDGLNAQAFLGIWRT